MTNDSCQHVDLYRQYNVSPTSKSFREITHGTVNLSEFSEKGHQSYVVAQEVVYSGRMGELEGERSND